MNYFDYIRKLRKNPIAKKVKQADLLHNSDVTRLSDCEICLLNRYHGCMEDINGLWRYFMMPGDIIFAQVIY